MEPLELTDAELNLIASRWLREDDTRKVLSNDLDKQIKLLFPKAPKEFLDANSHFSNELARGAGELADTISAAGINWTGPAKDTGVEQMFTKELVRLMAVDGLVSGKLALFPRIDSAGKLKFDALTGYLHPVFADGDALNVKALLQVTPVYAKDELQFQVKEYRPGMLAVYPAVAAIVDYAKGTPEEYPQQHSPNALPVAFKIIRRDAHRRASGLVSEALSAFRRYAKSAIVRNAVAELAGFPERVVKSDEYLRLIQQGDPLRNGQEHPAVTALKQIGPRQLKVVGTSDAYDIEDGVDIAPHIESEDHDRQSLLDVLSNPDLQGGNVSGIALAERTARTRALITDMCGYIADLVTESLEIADALPNSGIAEGIQASLTPSWAVDRSARVQEVTTLYQAGALPKSVLYSELQTLGYSSITDKMLEAQIALEAQSTTVPGLDDAVTAG